MSEIKQTKRRMYLAFVWVLFAVSTLCGIVFAYERTSAISQGAEYSTIIFPEKQ